MGYNFWDNNSDSSDNSDSDYSSDSDHGHGNCRRKNHRCCKVKRKICEYKVCKYKPKCEIRYCRYPCSTCVSAGIPKANCCCIPYIKYGKY